MRHLEPGDVRQADRTRYEVSLFGELFGHEGDRGDVSASQFHSVTHGAGCAAASMAVGGDDRITFADDRVQHLVRDDRGGVALVVVLKLGLGKFLLQRGFHSIQKSDRIGTLFPQNMFL